MTNSTDSPTPSEYLICKFTAITVFDYLYLLNTKRFCMMKKRKNSTWLFWICIISAFPLFSQSVNEQQLATVKHHLFKKGLITSDLLEMKITDQYYTKSLDITHIYFQQYFQDIPVENAIVNSGFKGDRLVQINHTFADHVEVDPNITNRIIPSDRGLRQAMNVIGKEEIPLPSLKRSETNSRSVKSIFTYDKGEVANQDIKVQLLWVKTEEGLRLCWQNEIDVKGRSNEWLLVQVDALSGEFLKQYNRVIECNFDLENCPEAKDTPYQRHFSQEIIKENTVLTNSYNVFDLPVESPNHGSRTVILSPWTRPGAGNPATTLGWHDNGGTPYTITRGNNVFAYEDQDANNSPGYSPDGGTSLDFNYGLDFSLSPISNMDASITNLFYTCNLTHDILYQYGFDEVAGNFQTDNLGRGGSGNDHVLAEAFDGGGTNNANFATPSDGGSGRMQMFLWSGAATLDVNSPQAISGKYYAAPADFGPTMFNVTGDLIVVNDGSSNPNEGCNALLNGGEINGNIAVIDRGTCEFGIKVLNAQNAGAIAAIVCNNIAGDPIAMGPGADGASVTIPSIMISQSDCELIKMQLPGVNVTMKISEQLDGAFDNGIVIHEYGHGLSNRLTGGPAAASCLNNDEQMGEGWSDFLTYILATDWSTASITDSKGIGTYATGQPPTGIGIRTYPYSTDMGINPFTYADVATAPVFNGSVSPHFIGSIWATMLWDMTWNIIAMEGIDPDLYHGSGGNNIALQLVMDGMKLQPCSPGFVDGRNAILLADELLYDGKYKCAIWDAFARRGLGVSADQGASSSYTDGAEAFDLPGGVEVRQHLSHLNAKEGEIVEITSEVICNCAPENNYQLRETINEGYSLVNVIEGTPSGSEIVSSVVNLAARDTLRIKFNVRIDLCSAEAPVLQLNDDVKGTAQMDNPRTQGKQWKTNNALFRSPSNSWYAENYSTGSDIQLEMVNNVTISGYTLFTFYHRFETEETWDGGVVEISTNNGSTWSDLGPYIIENGYPSSFAGNGSSNLAGRQGYTGSSTTYFGTSGFVKTVINLSDFAGQNIKIRFRFASDSNTAGTGINGWYIDDINITQFSGIQLDAIAYQNGSMTTSGSAFIQVDALNQELLYVAQSASGARNGGSWTDAYLSLRDAMTTAGCNNIDTIYLAEGTYLPSNQRDTSFILPSNLTIKGGYANGGGSRDPLTYLSILSGDIGATGDNTDNSFHVIFADGTVVNTTLDGLIIENGQADGGGEDNLGSAIYNLGQLTLKDVVTRNNTGDATVSNNGNGNIIMKGKNILEN